MLSPVLRERRRQPTSVTPRCPIADEKEEEKTVTSSLSDRIMSLAPVRDDLLVTSVGPVLSFLIT